MRSGTIDSLLRAVARHCTVPDIATEIGITTSTTRRRLDRAEIAELVTMSEGKGQLTVWELTDRGRERLRTRQPILGTRTSVPAGTVVE